MFSVHPELREMKIKKVFLVFDPDAGKMMEHNAKSLAQFGFKVYPVIIGGFKDPAELGRGVMSELVNTVMGNAGEMPRKIFISL